MKLYYHHVGEAGARRDFPKTIFSDVSVSVVEAAVPKSDPSREALLAALKTSFPEGRFNCWGVPSGAKFVIRNLAVGDVVLLVNSVHLTGAVPALCEVLVFLAHEYRDLSHALWGDDKYPYIFFFHTERIELPWVELLDRLGYKRNFDPQGKFYSVADSKLTAHGGPRAFVQSLRTAYGPRPTPYTAPREVKLPVREAVDDDPDIRLQLVKLRQLSLTASPSLTADSEDQPQQRIVPARTKAFREAVKEIYGYACAACGLKALSPSGLPEVEAAHIFPKAQRGSDDLRNGLCLCRFHHWAFDAGWFALRDDLTFIIRSDLPRSPHFKAIELLRQSSAALPSDIRLRPHPIYLTARRRLHAFE